ncbi:MAG: amidohydrolase family protein [Thermodesulfobacteriota bacterium]
MPDVPGSSPLALRVRRALTMVQGAGVLDDAMLVVKDGRIAEVGPYGLVRRTWSGPVRDLGDGLIAPGLINCHSHLELSHLRGRTVSGQGFTAWVRSLLAANPDLSDPASLEAACSELAACGTALVLDVTSRRPAEVSAALDRAGVEHLLLLESFGFAGAGGLDLPSGALDLPREFLESRCAVAGHSLATTHPEALRAAHAWCAWRGRPFSLHLAEHEGEADFLSGGQGGFARLLRERVAPADFTPPGCSPVSYADSLGLLGPLTLAVHCVHLSSPNIRLLAGRGVTVCLCPRSNAHIGVGRAPWERLRDGGVRLVLGADSLASCPDLDLWGEAAYILERFEGRLTLAEAVSWMTVNPARLLGREADLGTLEVGRRAVYTMVPEALVEHL